MVPFWPGSLTALVASSVIAVQSSVPGTLGWLGCDDRRLGTRGDSLADVRDVVFFITLIINVASMIGLIAGILMHSGRGGGLSDMFGGGGSAALGSTAAERNLNRITFVLALIWIFSLIAVSFFMDYS